MIQIELSYDELKQQMIELKKRARADVILWK